MCVTKFLYFSQCVKLLLSFYHKRISQRVWMTIWISWGKKQRSSKPFPFQYKKKLQILIKMLMVSVVTNSYKTKFIDSARSMENSLSNVADNFTEGIHEIK